MFADDTKISRKITDVQDGFLLQDLFVCSSEMRTRWVLAWLV